MFSKEKEEKETANALAAHKPAGVLGRILTCIERIAACYDSPCRVYLKRYDVFTFFLQIFGGSCAALLQSLLSAEAIKFVGRITFDLRIYQGTIPNAEFLLSVFPDKLEAYCLIITLRIGNLSVAVAHLLHTQSRVAASFWGHSQRVWHSMHDAAGRSHRRMKHL